MADIELAVATLGFDGFGDEDFVPTFELAPRLGIRDIEFNCWHPRNLTPTGIDGILRRSRDAGLRPVSIHAGSFAAADAGPAARETARWLWLIEACTRLGAGILKATGPRRGGSGDLASIVALLRDVAPVAADRGVTIALENHVDNALESARDYETIFGELDGPGVGMCLDSGHFAASGIDPTAMLDAFAGRVVHIDLKDCARAGGEYFVPFGDGIVDFDRLIRRAVELGYRGHLVVEFPRRGAEHVLTDLGAGADLAHRALGA